MTKEKERTTKQVRHVRGGGGQLIGVHMQTTKGIRKKKIQCEKVWDGHKLG